MTVMVCEDNISVHIVKIVFPDDCYAGKQFNERPQKQNMHNQTQQGTNPHYVQKYL
ncbi:hypothetical protein ES708_02162 [subsurface metagenome]